MEDLLYRLKLCGMLGYCFCSQPLLYQTQDPNPSIVPLLVSTLETYNDAESGYHVHHIDYTYYFDHINYMTLFV